MPTIFLHLGKFQPAKWGNFNRRKLGNIQPALTLRIVLRQAALTVLVHKPQVSHAVRVARFRRFAIPDHGLCPVLRQAALTVLVHDSQISHAVRVARLRRFAIPDHSLCIVLRQTTLTVLVHKPQIIHAVRVARFRRFAIPDHSLCLVLRQAALTVLVHDSQIIHAVRIARLRLSSKRLHFFSKLKVMQSVCVARLRRFAVPVQRLCIVLRQTTPSVRVSDTKLIHGARMARVRLSSKRLRLFSKLFLASREFRQSNQA